MADYETGNRRSYSNVGHALDAMRYQLRNARVPRYLNMMYDRIPVVPSPYVTGDEVYLADPRRNEFRSTHYVRVHGLDGLRQAESVTFPAVSTFAPELGENYPRRDEFRDVDYDVVPVISDEFYTRVTGHPSLRTILGDVDIGTGIVPDVYMTDMDVEYPSVSGLVNTTVDNMRRFAESWDLGFDRYVPPLYTQSIREPIRSQEDIDDRVKRWQEEFGDMFDRKDDKYYHKNSNV